MKSASISIIIPVLNEETHIQSLLIALQERSISKQISEIIVVDGGSSDATLSKVRETTLRIPIHVLQSDKGRAVQMNKGASVAKGSIFYFLHADTIPPLAFDQAILSALETRDAGCFRLKFDSDHILLKSLQWFTRYNWRICRGGDQSLFIKRSCFESLNGFDESYTIYEDCEFIDRIYKHHSFKVLPNSVVTSARKYREVGTTKLQFHFSMIHLKKWMGASPSQLVAYYEKNILP